VVTINTRVVGLKLSGFVVKLGGNGATSLSFWYILTNNTPNAYIIKYILAN
jgi:hypothetical protein